MMVGDVSFEEDVVLPDEGEPDRNFVRGLSRDDVRNELNKRNITPTGVQNVDAARLSEEFDKEFESEMQVYRGKIEQNHTALIMEEENIKQEFLALREAREESKLGKACPELGLFLRLARENKTQSFVSFSGSPIMARAISRVLAGCSSLVSLNLANGDLGDSGVAYLSRALQGPNIFLKNLDLENNHIGPAGARDLGLALSVNQSLTTLSLENNDLTRGYSDNTGIKAIATALTTNTTIMILNLNRTALGTSGGSIFVAAIQKNSSIVVLDLDFNGSIKASEWTSIINRIAKNKEALAQREESERLENETKLHALRFQRSKEAKEKRQEEERAAADERSRSRQIVREQEYEQKCEERRIRLEEGHAHALAYQAAWEEVNLDKKKKKK